MSVPLTTLQTHDGAHYVCAEIDGRLVADRAAVGAWEEFVVVSVEPGVVALQTVHGGFLSALDEETCAARALPPWSVQATAAHVDIWERWRVVPSPHGGVGLLSHWGRFLVAEGGGGGAVLANREYSEPGPWESFTAPGLTQPNPGPGPLPGPLDPLSVDDSRRYFRASGRRFDWREVSAFALLAMIQAGRHAEARAWIRDAVRLRFTVGRVFLTYTIGRDLVPNGGPDRPGFWEALDALTSMAAEEGFRLRLTLFAALEPFGATWDPIARRGTFLGDVKRRGMDFAGEVSVRLRSLPHAQIQVANEPAGTGFSGLSREVVEVGRVVAREAPDLMLDAGDVTGMDFPLMFDGCFDTVTRHIDRNMGIRGIEGAKRMGEDEYRDGQPRAVPAISGEPHNIGESRRDGRTGDVVPYPIFAYTYAAVCRSRQILPNFHFDGGLYCAPMAPITVECAEAFHRALDAFPMVEGERWRGHWGQARGDYWRDVWPGTDDVREIERHVQSGRGPWRAFGIGPWQTLFPEPREWEWRSAAEAEMERVDHFQDDAYGVGIYLRL